MTKNIINKKAGVLFVCLGNICRSPLGEGVFRHLVEVAGLRTFIRETSGSDNQGA